MKQFDISICEKANKTGLYTLKQEISDDFVSKMDLDKYKKSLEEMDQLKQAELNRVRQTIAILR